MSLDGTDGTSQQWKGHPEQVSLERSAGIGPPGQRSVRTIQPLQVRLTCQPWQVGLDRSVWSGQFGKVNLDMSDWKGQPGLVILERSAWTGQPGKVSLDQVSLDRSAWIGQPKQVSLTGQSGQSCLDRTA